MGNLFGKKSSENARAIFSEVFDNTISTLSVEIYCNIGVWLAQLTAVTKHWNKVSHMTIIIITINITNIIIN
jgi:hypothetical protein